MEEDLGSLSAKWGSWGQIRRNLWVVAGRVDSVRSLEIDHRAGGYEKS